ncbi:TIR domain-containing protein [Listeria sp. FSL L7-1517]|uniref:TIR domain-containing protein n=1 Tax=Listeria immobilis TaxID=2713502 RepID=UPI00164E1AFC|nr:TIR domain-containing protein [Listeria immobilis]MBC6298090.1 TIR domain-containing protein [Listeria immobilis]
MPYLKNYKLLISHSWNYTYHYDTIKKWLDSSSLFRWANHSISANNPYDSSTDKELKEKLTRQISGCSVIIVVAGMYSNYSKWIDYEIDEAVRMNKPIIGLKPWGSERTPLKITNNATVLVNWSSSGLLNAVRSYAKQ